MKFRLSPLRTAALVAASLFLAPQGMAADAQNGLWFTTPSTKI